MKKLRIALRTLRKAPSVTIIAIISLALGIGSTTAIFSIFNQILQRPLPVAHPNELVNLAAPGPKSGSSSSNQAGDTTTIFSYPMFRDLEKAQTVFTGIAAHRIFGANLSYRGQTTSSEAELVSGSYFTVLGIQPALGRLISPGDDRTVGESPIVVLSHAYWRTRFEASPAVLNETLIVNGQALTIVGVAPAGFDGTTLGSMPRVFVPITMAASMLPNYKGLESRRDYRYYMFARLNPGMSIEKARLGINVPYHAVINDVEVPLNTGMSEATLAKFKAKQVTLDEGFPRSKSDA